MGEVYSFSTGKKLVTEQEKIITHLLQKEQREFSWKVEEILCSPKEKIVIMNIADFESLLRQIVFEKCRIYHIPFSLHITLWLNYLVDLSLHFVKLDDGYVQKILAHPYFFDLYFDKQYKLAWDVCMYHYMFWKENRFFDGRDYLEFAYQAYSVYFWDASVAKWIIVVAPLFSNIQNILKGPQLIIKNEESKEKINT